MNSKENWFVIYTRSKHEKILAEQLQESGYEVFLPLIKKHTKWTDRRKVIEVPLFSSYVFIKGVNDKSIMKDFNSFVMFLQYNNKPAIVRQHEIDTLKLILEHGYDVSESGDINELRVGAKVMVIGGPLKGLCGHLVSISEGERFLMEFEDITNGLQVKIPSKALKVIYD